MVKKINFYKLGYDMAKGTKGTRWMVFSKSELKEANAEEGSGLDEKFTNWAEGWKETEQWDYEVGKNMSPVFDKEGDINEERMEEENAWIAGYVDYMKKIFSKKSTSSRKKLKEVV